MIDPLYIRNFCIIAHIDHGKSTLADRFLEMTGTVEKRRMKEQYLDTMDLERERGITIKLAPVRMRHTAHGQAYVLNLIDTPGHVDFSYEVSRALAAVEGAVLLVDATQGVQAQTIANLTLALAQGLTIIPAVNKIDLPNAAVEETIRSVCQLIGCREDEVYRVSGKTGEGVASLLEAIINLIPPPARNSQSAAARALVFDSQYDPYRGVVMHLRMFDGMIESHDAVLLMGTYMETQALEVGCLQPHFHAQPCLSAGEIGYVVTGLKEVRQAKVGDTVTCASHPALNPLPGYREVRPFVYAGLFTKEGTAEHLRDAIEKLQLSDASLTYIPQRSVALGFGFRCGFLGLLHLEIVLERLRREYELEVIATIPNVEFRVLTTGTQSLHHRGDTLDSHGGFITMEQLNALGAVEVTMPQDFPDPSHIVTVYEPWVHMTVLTPRAYIGGLIQFMQGLRGIPGSTEYLADGRAVMHYDLPLTSVIVNFYDKLKSVSQGYASMDYELAGYREADIQLLDIIIAGEKAPELSILIEWSEMILRARSMVELLKAVIPRQMFAVKIQAAVGAKIVASEVLSARAKDVTAKLYGGDVTRKMKLLKKQKEGKKRMAQFGKVTIPPEAYRKLLQRG